MWKELYVGIQNIYKTVRKKVQDDLLLPQRFWSVHLMDTLLSYVATGEGGSKVMQF